MIRRALMALFAVMTPSQVLAADWALVATSSNDVRQYLDVGSVSRNGDDRSIWVKEIDPKTAAHGEAYSVLHWRYDCSARTGTLLSWMQYRAKGRSSILSRSPHTSRAPSISHPTLSANEC